MVVARHLTLSSIGTASYITSDLEQQAKVKQTTLQSYRYSL